MSSSPITTHVLDTALGKPAAGVPIQLDILADASWQELANGATDADGRLRDLLPPTFPLAPGLYRLTFDTGAYYNGLKIRGFYPYVSIVFEILHINEHYHVPLLLNPFGYSTYRGS
jgi:5-hydroxyisourate hydrolase